LAIVAENQSSPEPAQAVLWVGTAGEMEEELVGRAGLLLETISGGGVHGVGLRQLARNGPRLMQGWRQARRIVRRFGPDVALLTGGYTNIPVALAAWERRVPLLIFLPDIEPGLAIRTLSHLAQVVACTAEASRSFLPPQKVKVTGYPVRPGLVPGGGRAAACRFFELKPDLRILLVFGGSRGARTINTSVMEILPQLLTDYQMIHISGHLDWEVVAERACQLPADMRIRYRPFAYLHEEMGQALQAADLVVARAGAATLGEFPAFGLPAVLVPYPFAWRYQKVNADYMASAGAAVRLNDELMEAELLPTVQRLMNDPAKLESMRQAALSLNRPRAARQISDLLASLARSDRL